ncbi:MAG: L-threonylcarbamoyladenylate synthase [Chitinophagaceae bacterium]
MDFSQDVNNALLVLQQGGLILYPTDTIWGIGCDATNPEAVKKIYDLKQREETKGMIILLADERDLLTYVSQPNLEVFNYLETVHKPTTVIYEGAIGVADNLVHADGSVAIRIVKETFCKHLIKRLRKPLVSTSANISGHPAPAFFKDVSPHILRGVDYIVNHRQDDVTPHQPSAVVKWHDDGTLTVIRP